MLVGRVPFVGQHRLAGLVSGSPCAGSAFDSLRLSREMMLCDAKQRWLRVGARIAVVSQYGLAKASAKSIKSLHCITYGRAHDKTIGRKEKSEKRIHCRWCTDRRRPSQMPTENKTKPIVLRRLVRAMSAQWLGSDHRLGITSSNFARIFIIKIPGGQFPCIPSSNGCAKTYAR